MLLANLKEATELYLENAKALGMIDDLEDALTGEERFTSVLEVQGPGVEDGGLIISRVQKAI